MTEDQLSEKESFEIIHRMIGNARSNVTDNGFGWLLWGTLIFLASISTYVFIDIGYKNIFLGWNIFGGISVLLLLYEVLRPKKKNVVRTYIDEILRLVDIAFIVCLFLVIFSINVAVGPNGGFGYLLMIYGFLMLIQGGALRFMPLTIGAIVNWIGAAAVFINKDFKYDMLITAAAVLIGYIIPGIILWRKFNTKREN